MHDQQRILVVGTTPDYVDIISSRFGRKVLFLTDFEQSAAAREIPPFPEQEFLCDLRNYDQTLYDLKRHLFLNKINVSGISCFDCESLELAAFLAKNLNLPFPSSKSILRSRNKFLTKQIWKQAGIPCPEARLVADVKQLIEIMTQLSGSAILKPMTGSGSELIFKCADLQAACRAFDVIQGQLAVHPNARMYGETKNQQMVFNSRKQILFEEFIDGQEYSCDFILEGDKLEIIRLASKILDPDQSTGTALAYVIPGQGFDSENIEHLKRQLYLAARVLGLDHAVCMADFIVSKNAVYLLEITPRLGGDCLPQLIMASSGLDAIGLALNFSAGKPVKIPEKFKWKTRVGVRIFASSAGVVQNIDAGALCGDDAIISSFFKAYPGFRVELPPKDYDSRVLGHVIFRPDPAQTIELQCKSIISKINIKIGN